MAADTPSTATPPSPAPLSVAATIGVITIAMVGSSISSQLVDLAIADIGGRRTGP